MASGLALSAVDGGFEPDRIKPKTIQLVFTASLVSTHHLGIRENTRWFEMKIMCPSGATCLSC